MLPPAYRLRRSADFQRAVRRGRRGSAATTVIHVYAGSSTPRVGFVVSRAVGGAVVRNRVRRRLRDIVRARLDRLPAGAIVVRATSRAAEASHAELGADVDRCLERLQESRRRP